MLAPTKTAAVKMAATAAEMWLETFENILISFVLEPVFRGIAKMFHTMHRPCQFSISDLFQCFSWFSLLALNLRKLIFGEIY